MKAPSYRYRQSRRGIALITVLAVVILLSLLVVTFLIRAGVARTSSTNFRATSATRVLSDTVVNLVQAEINDATTYGTSTGANGTAPYTWASQPGAIRVYDSTGAMQKIYRLYSASSLTATKVTDLLDTSTGNTVEIPSAWSSSPAQWVDLNAPVMAAGMTDSNGNPVTVYPILDPRSPTSTTFPAANLTSSNLPGFALNSPPGATAAQPAPMPVQWLYVLQNGQIIPPTSGTGTSVTFTGDATLPSKDNPIVGRIAFWTDDETCKVNINTAGGNLAYRTDSKANAATVPTPAPWDTPRFVGSWEDVKLFAEDQPVGGEYQRYPGHPGNTILYYIFNALGIAMPEIGTQTIAGAKLGYTAGINTQNGGSVPTGTTSALYSLLPRYNDDYGSQEGVANTTASNSPTSPTTKRDRLYTSLGEMLYTPARGKNDPTSPLVRQQLETGKFFLTAHSRSPEVTLFGTPRVTMWPIPDTTKTSVMPAGTPTQTAIDKLIAFCSTTDTGKGQTGNKYFFQRYDSTSTTNDWLNEPRNQALYGYLQDLTSGNIPGYGGNFLAKYGGSNNTQLIANERDAILTEMVDYIRCTNLNDHGNPTGVNFATRGEVVPLTVTSTGGSSSRTASTTSGLGRIETLSEIGLHIICTADGTNSLAGVNSSNTNSGWVAGSISGSSVGYNTPVIVGSVSATIPVSPVIGSAADPAYVSNLPTTQFLRNLSNAIVDVYGVTVTAANVSQCVPFPANQTLTTTGLYGGPLAALPVGSRQLQAMLIFELASPMNGYDLMGSGGGGPSVNIHVTNIQNIPIAGQNPFPSRTDTSSNYGPNVNGNGYLNGTTAGNVSYAWVNNGDPDEGGVAGFRFPFTYFDGTSTGHNSFSSRRVNGWSGVGPLQAQSPAPSPYTNVSTNDTQGQSATAGSVAPWTPYVFPTGGPVSGLPYRFVSNPFTVATTSISMGGTGSSASFNVSLELPVTSGGSITHIPYQTFTVAFPAITLSAPTLCAYGFKYNSSSSTALTHAPDWWGFDNRIGWCNTGNFFDTNGTAYNKSINMGLGSVVRGDNPAPPGGGWGSLANVWSFTTTTGTNSITTALPLTTTTVSAGDILRTIVPTDCDYRVSMARPSKADFSLTVNADPSTTHPDFIRTPQYSNTSLFITDLLMEPKMTQATAGVDLTGCTVNTGTMTFDPSSAPKIPGTLSSGTPNPQLTWDWDSGMMTGQDGAFAGKADEGNVYTNGTTTNIPYINTNLTGTIASYFTANRMLASAVAFGSLPTGVAEGIPWRTLLFRPQANRAAYTGLSNSPKDYLFLDLFNMPVVQPYAISEPFSTAGKINMNYQILPFTYILRDTGIRAVIGSELVARIPLIEGQHGPFNRTPYYKGGGVNFSQTSGQTSFTGTQTQASASMIQTRLPINLDETTGTLRQFQDKFKSGDIFKSAAEICDLYLVPYDATNTTSYTGWMSGGPPYTAADTGWYGSDFALVGDNVREHPYGDIYPRLTTKSNTFTVHFRVQSLKNPPNADQTQWTDGTGVVTGEYRGSTTLERYLDPNNNNIPDYASAANNPAVTPSAPSLDTYYQWRVVANNSFAP